MSLQVWLPLNGDLHNQGLRQNLNIIGTNITFSNNGKIGKCADFNGTSSCIHIPNFSINNQWSYGCWVNTPTSDTRGWELVIILNNSGSDADSQLAFWIHQKENRIESLANTKYTSTIPYTPYYNSWHHFFATYNGTVLTSYIDGTIVKTQTITDEKYTGTNLTIGARCTAVNGSSFSSFFQGSLNDIRIYDHCLSQKEVEEIAKGLVLHYKLDDIKTSIWNFNYYKRTATLTTSNTYIYSLPSKTIYLVPGKQYTVGAQVRVNQDNIKFNFDTNCTDEDGIYTGNDAAQTVQYNPTITLEKDAWTQVWVTTTIKSDAGKPYYHHGFLFRTTSGELSTLCEIQNIEIYEGSAQIFTTYDNNNIVYDSSGYNNNGTIIGSLEIIPSTPRYNYATQFDENTDSITVLPYLSNGQTLNEVTASCWFKTNTLNSTAPNIFSLGENAFLRCRLASATSIWSYYRVVSTQKSSTYSCKNLIDNNWHLLTFTFLNGIEKVYIDGVQIGSTDQSSTGTYLTCANIAWHLAGYSANSENFIGALSDFRIYTTALTAEQVKELYNTSATIDNQGNIHTRELVE